MNIPDQTDPKLINIHTLRQQFIEKEFPSNYCYSYNYPSINQSINQSYLLYNVA